MRVRSRYFVLSGALGGLVGFLLMETVSQLMPGGGSRAGDILRMALYFAGFGLAVGAGLGMTEGAVLRKPGRLAYGLILGLLLGALGGFAGGAVGQAIYGLAPLRYASRAHADIAIVLDSSGSMRQLFLFGNDPHGERRKAARNLVDRLAETDRVAVVDFDEGAAVLYPLTALRSRAERSAAKAAIDNIDDDGGTNLSSGLDAGVGELLRNQAEGRRQFLIFLTDGEGDYSPESAERARQAGITVYTIGLGQEVAPEVLQGIAAETGGQYYPVGNAAALTTLFERIFTENIDMASRAEGAPVQGAEPLTSPALLFVLRIVSWAAMGLAIGLGQGVRENTREDLRACGLGGLLGGILGGALFDPVTQVVTVGAGLVGRALADVVVGACIGGSMRLAQERMVEATGRPTTTLLAILPEKSGALVTAPVPSPRRPAPAPPLPVPAAPRSTAPPARVDPPARPAPPPASPKPASAGRLPEAGMDRERPPLTSFDSGNNRDQAMAMAYRSGYTLSQVAEHFGVSPSAVKRAANQYSAR